MVREMMLVWSDVQNVPLLSYMQGFQHGVVCWLRIVGIPTSLVLDGGLFAFPINAGVMAGIGQALAERVLVCGIRIQSPDLVSNVGTICLSVLPAVLAHISLFLGCAFVWESFGGAQRDPQLAPWPLLPVIELGCRPLAQHNSILDEKT